MTVQRVAQVGGVREGCMPGAGATQVLRTFRAPEAALVAPAPGTPGIRKISDTDTKRICAGYKPNRFRIAC